MRTLVLIASIAAGIAAVSAMIFVKLRPIPPATSYVGSARCTGCHRDIGEGWRASLHTKMMRPLDEPGALVADLKMNPDAVPFPQEEAVWAIGGKWEQQFMGRRDGQETLLPGAWEVEHREWRLVGWDGWKVPEPLRRCHGCHTVGLDPKTGEFVEPNIGCESCHGPGSWHVDTHGLGRIHSSADPQVCGQCHSRGRSPDGEFYFPADYRPGEDLSEVFVHSEPSKGQNSSSWWGNGRERRRHQQFSSWSRGGHASSLESLREGYDDRYGPAGDECLSCHAAEAILDSVLSVGLEDARWGITCQVCHNVHGKLDEVRVECEDCHQQGPFQHRIGLNPGHIPCPDGATVDCVSCHMPQVVRNGGSFTMRSHSPGVVHPRDTGAFGIPNSCANGGCHTDASWEELAVRYDRHYSE